MVHTCNAYIEETEGGMRLSQRKGRREKREDGGGVEGEKEIGQGKMEVKESVFASLSSCVDRGGPTLGGRCASVFKVASLPLGSFLSPVWLISGALSLFMLRYC